MTWEETIQFIRTKPEFASLVDEAYFHEDLGLNVERYKHSPEYRETLQLIRKHAPNATTILDIGSGNGISAIAFAIDGYNVTVSEPDPSDTVGAGAVRKLAELYDLENVQVHEDFAENINFSNQLFDVVYVRQAMHHAYNLEQFINNLTGLLKPDGLLITIRDHVVFDDQDKDWFLRVHPLHKFYGGENAFTEQEYKKAFLHAGLEIVKTYRFFDSVINYFPMTEAEIENLKQEGLIRKLSPVLGKYAHNKTIQNISRYFINQSGLLDEKQMPGRMYSFICRKK